MHSCRWLKCSGFAQGTLFAPWKAQTICIFHLPNVKLFERETAAYLHARQLFVLFPLGHFDWGQVCHSRDQEVHQDVLTVGGAVHQSSQRLGQVVGEQVVVVPVGKARRQLLCCLKKKNILTATDDS